MPDAAAPVRPRGKRGNKAQKPPKPRQKRQAGPGARKSTAPIRFVTAASLFDGHDAAINIMRRILQGAGAEVIHLGHNHSVDEVVTAAVQEDVQAIAISSYQGGHLEYFKYMIDLLAKRGRPDIKVFGGGGGVIVAAEIKELQDYGVARVYSPEDGREMGLDGMIADMMKRAAAPAKATLPKGLEGLRAGSFNDLARLITALELGQLSKNRLKALRGLARERDPAPVLGVTGTGGAGKSSLTDELIRRFRLYSGEPRIAVIAIDPSRRKTGGALLGDRIRMNALSGPNIYMRSLATREASNEVPKALDDIVLCCQAADFDLVIVETPGIGQGDAAIVDTADVSLYVMTPEFGAASQLEKIDMLDFADVVAINKMDRLGALDAPRDVRTQVQRNRREFTKPVHEMPVFGTIASRFSDLGVTALHRDLLSAVHSHCLHRPTTALRPARVEAPGPGVAIVPPERGRYLAEIAETVRGYHATITEQSAIARERQQLVAAKRMLKSAGKKAKDLDALIKARNEALDPRAAKLLRKWPGVKKSYAGDVEAAEPTLSGTVVPRVALPPYEDDGEILKFDCQEFTKI